MPHPDIVAVGVKDDGALSEHFFEAIGVELGLGASGFGIARGAFGLDNAEWFSVRPPQDVIGFPLPTGRGLMVDRDFLADLITRRTIFADCPTGIGQGSIDKTAARGGFVKSE